MLRLRYTGWRTVRCMVCLTHDGHCEEVTAALYEHVLVVQQGAAVPYFWKFNTFLN